MTSKPTKTPNPSTLSNVSGGLWVMRNGEEIAIKDMTDSHLRNAIHMLERGLPGLPEDDDVEAVDHWSLPGVVVIPGAISYREKIAQLQAELKHREALTNGSAPDRQESPDAK